MINFQWSDAAVTVLRESIASGMSCAQVAVDLSQRFSYVSRSAVIGKAHRLGLSKSYGPVKVVRKPKPDTVRRVRQKPLSIIKQGEPRPPSVMDLPIEESASAVALLDLREGVCRWPISGAGADTLFCGDVTDEEHVYCSRHHRRSVR